MKRTRQCMMSVLLAGFLVYGTGIALAGTVGAHVLGGIGDNPALLGFAPVFTMAAEGDIAAPGVAGAQALIDDWYDKDTKRISIRFDFSSKEKAKQTMDTIDRALRTFDNVDFGGALGLSLGRVALGVTSSAGTAVANHSQFDPDAADGGSAAKLDVTLDAQERVDAVVAVGVPLTKSVSLGASAKVSRFFAEEMVVKATGQQIQDDASAADPKGAYEVGEGLLFDAGLGLSLRYVQADVAIKDIGSVKWRAEKPPWDDQAVVGAVRDHGKPAHVTLGVVLKPLGCLDLGTRYGKDVFGSTTLQSEVALRPVRWLTLRAGQVTIDGTPAYLTLGGGMRLWVLGLDGSVAAKDNTIVGGRVRLSIGF